MSELNKQMDELLRVARSRAKYSVLMTLVGECMGESPDIIKFVINFNKKEIEKIEQESNE